jgi:hypothetical protein
MNTIGVLLLAAATATTGIGSPHSGKHWLRRHVVAEGPAPGPALGMPGGAGMAAQPGRRFATTRSQIYFVDPTGMKVGWQSTGPNGEKVYLPGQLVVPARYNFAQGYIYRLKLTDIPGRPNLQLYPTIEVAPSTPATDAYLSHNPIPVQFTEEDFDQVGAGNFVTKVVYLPDPKYQELAIAGVETLVSTRLEPGVDPILEADRRGTILMIIRVGAIDLEMPGGGASMPPGAPAHAMSPEMPMVGGVGMESAPVSPPPPAAELPGPPTEALLPVPNPNR